MRRPGRPADREVREEVGLTVVDGHLAAVDFLRPRPGKPGGMRFLFDCGVLPDAVFDTITLQVEELSEYRLVDVGRSARPPQWAAPRRVGAALTLRHASTWRTDDPSEPVGRRERERCAGRSSLAALTGPDRARGGPPGCKRLLATAAMPAAMPSDQVAPAWNRAGADQRTPNRQRIVVLAGPACGLVPPASHELDASPVRAVVSTVVDMSGTPMRRTAALRCPPPGRGGR